MAIILSWDGALSTEASNEFLTELALRHLGEAGYLPGHEDSPQQAIGQYIAHCLASGDFHTLCHHDFDVSGLPPLPAYHLGQALAFFRKRVDLDLGVDREAVAYRKFMVSESQCGLTNRLFRLSAQGDFQFRPDVEAALNAARRKIAEVLGDAPTLDQLKLRFGPGATTQIQKRSACAKTKLSAPPACSEDLLPILERVLQEMPGYTNPWEDSPESEFDDGAPLEWGDWRPDDWDELLELARDERAKLEHHTRAARILDCEVHDGVLGFVPKSAKTDRAIVVEPWLNSIVQLGVGDYIAKRLRRVGIDIRDQTRNQNLAREGSITGALATLDLSSASDTIAEGLVAELLPPEWYALLSLCRTSTVGYKGRVFRLEKFSSMGNGFTFPLETLIFWGLTRGACRKHETVSVYGDDIICPTHRVEAVIRVLTDCGFTINIEKSFWEGSFRESCGADWISGIDVRPVFMTGPVTGHDAFRLHNYYVRSGQFDMASFVLQHIDESVQLIGPDGYGDGHLVTAPGYELHWERSKKKNHFERGYGGTIFDTWVYEKRLLKRALPGDRILPTYSIYLRDETMDEVTGFATSSSDDRMNMVRKTLLNDKTFLTWLRSQDPDQSPSFFESLGQRFTDKGTPVAFLPGVKGCKRISIYTFS